MDFLEIATVAVELAGVAFIVALLLTSIFKKPSHWDVPIRDFTKGHRWSAKETFASPTYCSICTDHILSGAFCDSCGICADDACVPPANKFIRCKIMASSDTSVASTQDTHLPTIPMQHHWTCGNLPLCSVCIVCQKQCGVSPGLVDYRCCWCQHTVHSECRDVSSQRISWDVCDLGQFQNFIVPPNCVRLKKIGWKGRRHLVVGAVTEPASDSWSPLIVIGTKKSGNADGEAILSAFRGYLNPAQVIDCDMLSPESGLEWCRLIPEHTCCILVCGGDGTIGWVLSAIDNLALNPKPCVAILPLGTGNDLSRVLGWGEGYTGDIGVNEIMGNIIASSTVNLDRWKVIVTHRRRFGFRRPTKSIIMNNYASIGVDALVTLNFHRQRQKQPMLFRSRLLNKLVYFFYGTKDCLERECQDLDKKITILLDGNQVDLPELEGIVILNIPSWGAGCRVWEVGSSGDTARQRIDDGKLEVLGLYSSFHIAQLQVGLSEPVRLGQARKVRITIDSGVPMQVDGEPWHQAPAEITITHHNQATMLQYSRDQYNTSSHTFNLGCR